MRLINIRPDRGTRLFLAALPFVLLAAAYLIGSAVRLAENPADKLLPSLAGMGRMIGAMALNPDKRTGDYLLLTDTTASLFRQDASTRRRKPLRGGQLCVGRNGRTHL